MGRPPERQYPRVLKIGDAMEGRSSHSSTGSSGASIPDLEVEDEDHVTGGQNGDNIGKLSESEDAPFVNEVASLNDQDSDGRPRRRLTRAEERRKWWKVYALYFWFLWNSNIYEYASVVLMVFPTDIPRASWTSSDEP
jgi:hypothetical protein